MEGCVELQIRRRTPEEAMTFMAAQVVALHCEIKMLEQEIESLEEELRRVRNPDQTEEDRIRPV